jgi:GNAT superfamily N-acetyltransferase
MPLAYQSWSRTFRAEPSSQRMPDRAFYMWHRDIVDRLLASGAQVFVARDVERPVFLFGWLCAQRVGDGLVIHYAYCKRPWRERGIGHALLAAAVERLGEGATELLQSHGSRQYDGKLAAMGFRKVAVEKLLRAGKEAA